MTTSNVNLDAIRKRAEAASEGPWNIYDDIDTHGEQAFYLETKTEIIGDTQKLSDAEFIAHAREDVPALLAEVERLTGILDEAYVEICRGKNGRAISIIEDWGDSE